MEGGYLTALRTGAVSGAATRLLAREDAKVLTVIGAGAQAVTQVAGVCAVRPIERVNIVGRSADRLEGFRDRLERDWPGLGDRVHPTLDVAQAVREADVICTATTSRVPVFDDADVQPGTHINGVGSFTPAMQEVPAATIARSIVVVDQMEPALEEAGDLIIPLREGTIARAHLWRELGHLAAGEHEGRAVRNDITYFKSVGNAVQDMAVGRFAFEQAQRTGAGQSVSL
jgi:ornithine cyclodeaminase